MNKNRYSAKKQEEYFKPYRVRVLQRDYSSGYGYSSYVSYIVQIVDALTGEEVTRWCSHNCEGMLGHWRDEESTFKRDCTRSGAMGSKTRAIKVAKREAQFRNLPFNVSIDYIKGIDLDTPRRACLICDSWRRSAKPFVCDDCLNLHTLGQSVVKSDTRQWCGLDKSNLIPARPRTMGQDFTVDFLDLFGRIFGFVLEQMPHNVSGERFDIEIEDEKRKPWHANYVYFQLDKDQTELLKELYDLINKIIFSVYSSGLQDGEGFLRQLAEGKITVEKLQAREARLSL